jgi:hypothetical protein
MILKLYPRWPWEDTQYEKPESKPEPEDDIKDKNNPYFSVWDMYMNNPFILFLIFILLNLAAAPRPIRQELEEHSHCFEGTTHFRKAHYHAYQGTTNPARSEAGHIHTYETVTSTDLGHEHKLVGNTGPAVILSEGGHVHEYSWIHLAQSGHEHEYSGVTASV